MREKLRDIMAFVYVFQKNRFKSNKSINSKKSMISLKWNKSKKSPTLVEVKFEIGRGIVIPIHLVTNIKASIYIYDDEYRT